MVATHIFHKLVDSARLFMKKASWGSFVSELDSSGDLARQPELSDPFARVCSGTEVEVGRTSGEDSHGAAIVAPHGFRVKYAYFYVFVVGEIWSVSSLLYFQVK